MEGTDWKVDSVSIVDSPDYRFEVERVFSVCGYNFTQEGWRKLMRNAKCGKEYGPDESGYPIERMEYTLDRGLVQ